MYKRRKSETTKTCMLVLATITITVVLGFYAFVAGRCIVHYQMLNNGRITTMSLLD